MRWRLKAPRVIGRQCRQLPHHRVRPNISRTNEITVPRANRLHIPFRCCVLVVAVSPIPSFGAPETPPAVTDDTVRPRLRVTCQVIGLVPESSRLVIGGDRPDFFHQPAAVRVDEERHVPERGKS